MALVASLDKIGQWSASFMEDKHRFVVKFFDVVVTAVNSLFRLLAIFVTLDFVLIINLNHLC